MRQMLKASRRGDVQDTEAHLTSLAAVLAEYDEDIIRTVTDPRTGWPSENRPEAAFYPSIYNLRKLCDRHALQKAAAYEREQRIARQLREREDGERLRAEQVASGEHDRIVAGFTELQERFRPEVVQAAEERAQRRAEVHTRANMAAFARECRNVGEDPASQTASPSLRALLRRQGALPQEQAS